MSTFYKQLKNALVVVLLATGFVACDKDEKEILPEPAIEAVEIGEGNSKEVSVGQDLHIEAKVTAVTTIKEVRVTIKSEEGASSFEVNQDYPKLVGKTSGDIHSHFNVPQEAKTGKYVVSIQLTDNLGRKKEHKESLTVVAAKETPSAVKWHKMEIAFITGHSHGLTATSGYFHGNPEIKEVKYLKPTQKFVFENKEGKIVASTENTPIRWQARADDEKQKGSALYGIKIVYYDAQGNRINEQFATGSHQHFFLVEDVTKNINAPADKQLPQADKVLSFLYRDTNPESQDYNRRNPNLRDVNDPVGLKGVFEAEEAYINFNLRIVLARFTNENPKLVNGKTRVFNQLPVSAQVDTDVKIPVHIYTKHGSREYLKEAATEFSTTEEQIDADEDIIVEVDPHGPEGSPVYM
ncbi:MAG: DUF4625 domain-containing protein [Capnocytophaga felis]|nr:DUF4625 domain-containing protein [Capnocytophaga felis]